ncbi:MAG TPA: aminoglycoside phosphotransferase family protein [Gaiellaceae bacterium]
MTQSHLPGLDDARRRLAARFGAGVEPWFDELPGVLSALAEGWEIELGSFIPRGSMSVVVRCRARGGRPAVLKVSPDRGRLGNEAAALDRWTTVHTPSVLAVDESVGALLMEAIEPGTALIEGSTYPELERMTELLIALRARGVADPLFPPLSRRVAHLFDSGTRPYERHPELLESITPELYERGHRLATALADDSSPTTLLHGDLTPSNVLDGGDERGLVAIDPAPCLGDAAFDTVDLLLWQAHDVDTIAARADLLAQAIDLEAARLLDWCTAFAAMVALELAEAPDASQRRIEALVTLASRAP